MNQKTFFEDLKSYLQDATYRGTSNKILSANSVKIVPNIPIEQIAKFYQEQAFIRDQGYICHSEYNSLIYQKFSIILFVDRIDRYGEAVMVGGYSKKGVLEIEGEISYLLHRITDDFSEKANIVHKNTSAKNYVQKNAPAIFSSSNYEVLLSNY